MRFPSPRRAVPQLSSGEMSQQLQRGMCGGRPLFGSFNTDVRQQQHPFWGSPVGRGGHTHHTHAHTDTHKYIFVPQHSFHLSMEFSEVLLGQARREHPTIIVLGPLAPMFLHTMQLERRHSGLKAALPQEIWLPWLRWRWEYLGQGGGF